jgi:sporulation integral membrane protein YlbJ
VLPSLLPFMFFTKILTDLDFVSSMSKKFSKITKKLFCAPSVSTYIFFMSIISGYPVGAKLISEFYEAGIITTKQANKLTTFCSTSGPLFIIGSVGTAMFLSKKIGYILFASHIISSILNGILYRKAYCDDYEKEFSTATTNLNEILPNSMSSSITSVLIVGGYIAIFFMIIDLANSLNLLAPINYVLQLILSPFGVNLETAKAISSGIIEISKGCNMLSQLSLSPVLLTTLASFVISFGGLSVFCQSITFLSKCKVNMGFYLLQKFTHGLLSAGVTFVLSMLFL